MTQFFDLSPHLSPRGSENGDRASPRSKSQNQRGSIELDAPFMDPSPLKFESEARLLGGRNLAKQDFRGVATPDSNTFSEGAPAYMHSDTNDESLPPRTPRSKPRSCTSSQSTSRAETPIRSPSRNRTPSATPKTDRSYSVPSRYLHFTEARRAGAGTPRRTRGMSSQELEMQEIERKREEVRRLRKFNDKSYKRAIQGVDISRGTSVERSRGLTVPKEFNLSVRSPRSFDRDRDHMSRNVSPRTPKRTPSTTPSATPRHRPTTPCSPDLKRSASVPPKEWTPRLTVPTGPRMLERPRSFRSRSMSKDDHQPELSAVSCSASFMSATSRFEESIEASKRGRRWANTLTEPQPFDLSCNYRVRSTSVKSRDELEEEALQAIKSRPFKARPVPQSCREPSASGVPIVEKRPLTVPNEFALSTSYSERSLSRSRRDHSVSEEAQASTPFRARKIPKGILDGPTFVPKQADVPLTCPEAPSVLSERSVSRSKRELSTESQRSEQFRAREMPDFERLHFKPSPSKQILTVPIMPQLGTDGRGALHQARLEQKLQKAEDKRLWFRRAEASKGDSETAQEIPHQQPRTPKRDHNSDEIKTPKKDLYNLLEAAERAREASQAVDQMDQVPRKWRARPCPPTTYRPGTLPDPPEKVLTVPDDIELHSSVRSKSREVYEKERNQRKAEMEEQKRLLEQEKSIQEQHEILSIRKSQEFKAHPVPSTTYEPGKLPEKKVRGLTMPVDPAFAPHTARSESVYSDKENSMERNRYEPSLPAWQSARQALKKVQN